MVRLLLLLALAGALIGACATTQSSGPAPATPEAEASPSAAPAPDQAGKAAAIRIPETPARALLPRALVARALSNPRGMHRGADGALLVAEAGTGDPENPLTGTLARLADGNGDGDYLDEGERRVLLDRQPSKNILGIVRRDEVFGMAGIAASGDRVMVALAFFGGPSTIFEVASDGVKPWGKTHLNINDLAYDPGRKHWYGVASTTDEVVRLLPGEGVERVLKIPPMANGQDAVPGYLVHDPKSGRLLVSLFTGSPEGEEGGEGVELVHGAGAIISVDPETRSFEWLVTGLSVPTDLEIGPDGSLYVLEFCDAFLEPTPTRESMYAGTLHGGFKRHSGRLLRVSPDGAVSVVAAGLDAPSNLLLADGALYVAEGMGTPGRSIPGPEGGSQPLEGFIERIALDAPAPGAATAAR
ncbi:MAG: hypothetical protein OEZ06_02095 [Myxococcales bacterium]|nr:hypothetical protein [Myxococcales bacterium]